MTPNPELARPRRIQRKRTKGWKMPPNTVYVGRPTKWGNPWKVGGGLTATDCIGRFRNLIDGNVWTSPNRSEIKRDLRGRNLACWCPLDQPCHADVLLEIANAE